MMVLASILTRLSKFLLMTMIAFFVMTMFRVSSSMLVLLWVVSKITPWLFLMTLIMSINMWFTIWCQFHVDDDVVVGMVVTPMVGVVITFMTVMVLCIFLLMTLMWSCMAMRFSSP